MQAITRLSRLLAGSVTLLFVAPHALAGGGSVGSLTHVGLSEIPALGGFGLLLLSGLLGAVSLRFLKAREKGRFLVIAALAGTLASVGGVNVVSKVEAGITGISLFGDGEATVNIPSPGFHIVTNVTNGDRRITAIDLVDGCFLGNLENGGGNGGPANGGLNGGLLVNGGNGGVFRGPCNDEPGTRLGAQDFCELLVCCGGPNGGNGGCFAVE